MGKIGDGDSAWVSLRPPRWLQSQVGGSELVSYVDEQVVLSRLIGRIDPERGEAAGRSGEKASPTKITSPATIWPSEVTAFIGLNPTVVLVVKARNSASVTSEPCCVADEFGYIKA